MVKRWHIGGGITIIFSKVIKKPTPQNEAQSKADIEAQSKPENESTGKTC